MASGYRLDDRGVGVRVSVEASFFPLSKSSRSVVGPTQPPHQWFFWGSFCHGKWLSLQISILLDHDQMD
jgi:hypothetical protein